MAKRNPDEQPAFEGSLSDGNVMPAPDGHDIFKNALEPDEPAPAASSDKDDKED